ncbi:Pseudouridine-5'-phosphate glycosidase [Streptomyces glaucescens]
MSATALLAALAGVRVFATGGLGGVHRQWTVTQDESADLGLLARTRITVVCAGVKSILDVPATLQRLETLGVAVAGYGTDRFPGLLPVRLGTSGGLDPGQPAAGGGGDAGAGALRPPGRR